MRRLWPAALGAALAALACLRAIVAFNGLTWFDIDPVLDPSPFAGLGPAGSLRIDAAMAVVGAALLLAFAGRAAAMVAVGALAVVLARLGSETALGALGWRGLDWIASWIACAAAVAVARNPRQQARLAWSAMVSVLLGVCCLWLARGAWQWFHEHPSTVRFFHEQGRDAAFFADRGWDPEGPQALGYIRRLEQREMTGWFGLANIFAGTLAVTAVALAGLPREVGRRGMSWGLLGASCAVAVVANGSKGAVAAMLIGFAAVAALRWMRVRPSGLAVAAVGAALASALAPVLRGTLLAQAMPTERSLLFRWHYLRTAWSAWLESPWKGTGPEGFKDASARLRPPGAIELVQSAHGAFVDWIAQLGVGGACWIAAALGILAWSARGAALEPTPLPAPPARDGWPQRIVSFAVLLALGASLLVEAHTLDAASLVVRLVGGVAWAGATVTLLPRLWSARSCGAHMLFPAALVALCHAQVEMTLWNPGSCAWLLLVVGASVPPHALVPGAPELAVPPHRAPRVIAAVASLLVASACLLRGASESRGEAALERAADTLVREMRATSGVTPAQARRHAAEALRPWSRLLASDQLLRAAAAAGPASPIGGESLRQAMREADDAVERGSGFLAAPRLESLHAAALASELLARATERRDDLDGALRRALAVAAFDPASAGAWLRAARLARALGNDDAATLAWTALAADQAMSLDPLARLSPRDRAQAEAIAGVTSRGPAAAP